MIAMLANALVPHLALTLATRRYMPGTASGVLPVLPVLSMLVVRAVREHYVSGARAIEFAILVPLLLLVSIAALFGLGKALRL